MTIKTTFTFVGLLLASNFYISFVHAGVAVRGYYRKNGTYVSPHIRSNPDGRLYNNWSTVGNVNPYNGKVGTKTTSSSGSYPYNYTQPNTIYDQSSSSNQNEVPKQTVDENLKKDSREVAHYKTDLVPQHIKNESIATYLSTNKAEEKNIIENDITWVFLTKNNSDATYIRAGVREHYSDGYPIISMMFTGVMKPNGRPTWLGKRFIKMKINCNTQQAALVADAVINSDGTVVKNIIYREKDNVKWGEISMFYNTKDFFKVAKVCN
ncbi:TPA: hypothetical protein ACNIH0_003797 [Acinetobacter baumannii]|uniref:hypothetical protein n=1 Tax=Acinetobacter baumannii TaxID=470 RepID=UPI0024DE0B8E|nr:hypothetical protein [Acinetobacter baumannii]MDK2102356.1 hypothetical protein [Acinetobacter baumannii]MDK2147799.1 hypothetical protein [Acinetobacter baumannii]MDK2177726.1 hypothetical protein [Acinetobacter baumannii]MDK2196033.1 hypothetical protein [Acinetobacter baumannii]MDK2206437.1 hypothetical protein [Acinetobacter baumannii]